MLGDPESPHSLGVIPCAISWLFWLIGEQKSNTGARFSVRVSAVEVVGKQENVVDLLKDQASCKFDDRFGYIRSLSVQGLSK